MSWFAALLAVVVTSASVYWQPAVRKPSVDVVRVPAGGVQPEVAIDRAGAVHLVYLTGAPAAADVFYARSTDGGRTFAPPVRVNSQEGSAIATGTIRGAQLAVGPDGRVHVAWNGSDKALPKPPAHPSTGRAGMPMLYARSNAAGAFEAQRNLMTRSTSLDGGGSIAADDQAVYVTWHGGPADGKGGEAARRVWLARSTDQGVTFEQERPVSDPGTGVCGCCALRLFAAPGGELHLLYRSATRTTQRDVYSLVSRDRGRTFQGSRVHGWEIGACPMTSMSLAGAGPVLRAWETDGQVYFDGLGASGPPRSPALPAAGNSVRRKHPRLAVSANGTVLLAWTEGTSWGRGGSLAWQGFDRTGQPSGAQGTRAGLPAWSYGAVVARADGGFTILY